MRSFSIWILTPPFSLICLDQAVLHASCQDDDDDGEQAGGSQGQNTPRGHRNGIQGKLWTGLLVAAVCRLLRITPVRSVCICTCWFICRVNSEHNASTTMFHCIYRKAEMAVNLITQTIFTVLDYTQLYLCVCFVLLADGSWGCSSSGLLSLSEVWWISWISGVLIWGGGGYAYGTAPWWG